MALVDAPNTPDSFRFWQSSASTMNDVGVAGLVVILLAIFGLFGNANVVIATIRKKNLRTNNGILVCLLAVYDLVCLLFEVSNGIRMMLGTTLTRSECFKTLILYFCVQFVSASTLVGLALDRLAAVTVPFWYMKSHVRNTVVVATIPGVLLSGFFVVFGAMNLESDQTTVKVCFAGNVMPNGLQKYSNLCLFGLNVCVIVVYLLAYTVLHVRKRRVCHNTQLHATLKGHEKAMKSITVFLAIFVVTWFLSQVELALVIPLDDSVLFFYVMKKTIILPVIISYSQCYFVYFWRNEDYREAFIEQLRCGWWKEQRVVNRNESRVSVVTRMQSSKVRSKGVR